VMSLMTTALFDGKMTMTAGCVLQTQSKADIKRLLLGIVPA
jgi:hypothetical protein